MYLVLTTSQVNYEVNKCVGEGFRVTLVRHGSKEEKPHVGKDDLSDPSSFVWWFPIKTFVTTF